MSESQSRYSIVERLTNTKLGVIESKARLEEDLKQKDFEIEDLKKQLNDWSEDIKEVVSREHRNKERKIQDAERNYKNSKQHLETKRKVFDDKLKEIDDALKSIEEISRSAAVQESS